MRAGSRVQDRGCLARFTEGKLRKGAVPTISALGRLYDRLYATLCGTHPNVLPWHFQWLAGSGLYSDLHEVVGTLEGTVLDVGSLTKPYAQWKKPSVRWTGIDVVPGPGVDILISANGVWPLESGSYDVVLCTQVLEHVSSVDLTLQEMVRVLKPGGRLIISAPFIYNEHGAPGDYRRFSAGGLEQMIRTRGLEVQEVRRQGAIGSTLGILFLNWVDAQLNRRRVTRLAKGFLLPVWLVVCALVNCSGAIVNRLDTTNVFYGNVLVVARLTRSPGPRLN
jgi:SAM-dependent methyltransferase